MNALAKVGHLVRRFFTSLSGKPPPPGDAAWAIAQLMPGEAALWQRMPAQDRRHSILVARRFQLDVTEPARDETAAALLHDVGKIECELGTFGRVIATIVGPRTRRFRLYHDHERIGVELARDAESSAITLALLDGTSDQCDVMAALERADNV